jgi:hypothetical protein
MAPEQAGEGEFAQLVANHVLCDEDGHVSPAIMHSDGESEHLGHDGAGP